MNNESCEVMEALTETPLQTGNAREDTNKLLSPPCPETNEPVSSNVVIKSNTESLNVLKSYFGESDDDDDDDDDDEVLEPNAAALSVPKNSTLNYRSKKDSESCDSESDSSATTLSSGSESESDSEENDTDESESVIGAECDKPSKTSKGAVNKPSVTGYEIPKDFPPVPDLSRLNLNDIVEFTATGRVLAIIDDIVTVRCGVGAAALDVDSMLFIEDQTTGSKRPLGPIFDVFGSVKEPLYSVRFNDAKDIEKLGIEIDMLVYAAPKNDEYSKFVFLADLLKIKGSDASWLNDQEPPQEVDFSDDEAERQARRRQKNGGSLERHKEYEQSMNRCNALNTRVSRMMDARHRVDHQPRRNFRCNVRASRGIAVSQAGITGPVSTPVSTPLPIIPPEFNPSIPPPGFNVAVPTPPFATPTWTYFPGYLPQPESLHRASHPHRSSNVNWNYPHGPVTGRPDFY